MGGGHSFSELAPPTTQDSRGEGKGGAGGLFLRLWRVLPFLPQPQPPTQCLLPSLCPLPALGPPPQFLPLRQELQGKAGPGGVLAPECELAQWAQAPPLLQGKAVRTETGPDLPSPQHGRKSQRQLTEQALLTEVPRQTL